MTCEGVCQWSGEGGIRTLGTREGTPVFETGAGLPQTPDGETSYHEGDSVVAGMVAGGHLQPVSQAASADARLLRLITSWDQLPEHLRATISSLVDLHGPQPGE